MSKGGERIYEPGLYYVGDLCYLLKDEARDELIRITQCEDGEFTLPDGRPFAWFGTKYGDGTYFDDKGREYWVDSGTLGIIPVKEGDVCPEGGNFIKYNDQFSVASNVNRSKPGPNYGDIMFGFNVIDTDPRGNEEEEEDFEYEDED